MNGDELPNDSHVVRYVKPSLIDDEAVDGSAFVLRDNENGLSVNWLEAFGGSDHQIQLNEVQRVFRLKRSRNGRFAKINVGETKRLVSEGAKEAGLIVDLCMTEAPLVRTTEFEADPSHANITGVPLSGGDEAMVVGDLIADCLIAPLYLAFEE